LLKSKLEKFIAKGVLVVFVILTVLDLMLIQKKWFVLIGLFIGGLFSLIKFSSTAFIFSNLIYKLDKKAIVLRSVITYIINQCIAIGLLFVAAKINLWLLAGMTAGILLVPLVIFLYCISRAFSKSNNIFE
jgi:hypothetical protein